MSKCLTKSKICTEYTIDEKSFLPTIEMFYSYTSKSQYVTFELTVIKAFRISLINDKMVFNR